MAIQKRSQEAFVRYLPGRMNSLVSSPQNEARAVQDKVEQVEMLSCILHESVGDFVDAVNEEYIDSPSEERKKVAATKVIELFEQECSTTQELTTTCGDDTLLRTVHGVLAHVRDENEMSYAMYEKAMAKFKRRKKKYDNCSPLSRRFLSPRSQSAEDVWADKGPIEHPEITFSILVLVIAMVLITVRVISLWHISLREDDVKIPPPGRQRLTMLKDTFLDMSKRAKQVGEYSLDAAKEHLGMDPVQVESVYEREL